MKNIFFKISLIAVLVIYIYSIVFNVFPISTKVILEIIGFIYCLKYITNPKYRLKREYKSIIILIAALVVWDIIVSFLNGQSEFHLVKYMVPAIGSIFCAQMIYSFTKKHFINPDTMLLYIVITIFLESVLSIMMKIYPPLFDVVSSILRFEFLTNSAITFDLSRFIGIGNAMFFGVLPSCLLGVVSSVYLINCSNSIFNRTALVVMWVVIAITSFLTARWAITAIGLSVILFVLGLKEKNIIKTIGLMIGVGVIVGIAYIIVMRNINDQLYTWAFSFLADPSSSDDHTSEHLVNWWTNTDFTLKTFLIGDAQYSLPNGKYYGGSDVGYHRQLFYGGLIGLSLNLWVHYKVLKHAFKYNRTRTFKPYLWMLMLGYMAILAKGDATMLTFFILILVYYSQGAYEYVPQKRSFTVGQQAMKTQISIPAKETSI